MYSSGKYRIHFRDNFATSSAIVVKVLTKRHCITWRKISQSMKQLKSSGKTKLGVSQITEQSITVFITTSELECYARWKKVRSYELKCSVPHWWNFPLRQAEISISVIELPPSVQYRFCLGQSQSSTTRAERLIWRIESSIWQTKCIVWSIWNAELRLIPSNF